MNQMNLKGEQHTESLSSKKSGSRLGQEFNPILVGITGGTGAGKTTFARRLATTLATRHTVTLVDLDSYYKDFSFLSLPERQQINFDDPSSVDLVRFLQDLHRLRQRQAIVKPVYDRVAHIRHKGGPVVAPGEIVIAEGSTLFADEDIRSQFDVRIYIDTPAEVRLRRRLERDVRESGRTLAGAIDHYMLYVLPIHERFIEPIKGFSNFIISGWEDTEHSLSEVASVIKRSRMLDPNQSLSPPHEIPIESGSFSAAEQSILKQER